jgi:hypothetical protein
MNEDKLPAAMSDLDPDRLGRYGRLLDFYKGRQWPGREKYGEKRLTFNYAAVFIDKLTSYLMSGRNFTVESRSDTPQGIAAAEAAEKALEQVYDYNHMDQLDFETEIDCAILGDACYKVTWEEAENGEFNGSTGQKGRIRITAPDIRGISAWWTGDDINRIWKVSSQYSLSAEEARMIYNIKPWNKAVLVREIWTATDFELYLDEILVEKKPNPYGFIPFVIFANLREPKQFWGTSDLVNMIQPQQELNRALSQISHILELSGNPVAVLENVDESSDIAVRPGAVWNIPEDAKAYLLDLLKDGGLKMHIDYIEILYRVLHDIAETPRAAFGGSGRNLSGVAMQIELYPLIQKVQRKRTIRNQTYNQRNEMILSLIERFGNTSHSQIPPMTNKPRFDLNNLRLRTVWGQVLPADQAALIGNEKVLVDSGIHSRRRAMDELGVKDPEAEFKCWVEEERRIGEISTNNQGTMTNKQEVVS